jgi:hypothetical protein
MSTNNFNLVKELLEELIEQISNQVERPASPNIPVAPRIQLPLDLASHVLERPASPNIPVVPQIIVPDDLAMFWPELVAELEENDLNNLRLYLSDSD